LPYGNIAYSQTIQAETSDTVATKIAYLAHIDIFPAVALVEKWLTTREKVALR